MAAPGPGRAGRCSRLPAALAAGLVRRGGERSRGAVAAAVGPRPPRPGLVPLLGLRRGPGAASAAGPQQGPGGREDWARCCLHGGRGRAPAALPPAAVQRAPCLPALPRARLNRACRGRAGAGRAAPATLPRAPGTSAGALRPHPLLNAALCGTAPGRVAGCAFGGRAGGLGCLWCPLVPLRMGHPGQPGREAGL